jgi:hypothetical protein
MKSDSCSPAVCNARYRNLNAGLTCSMRMRQWTCKPYHCTMIGISERTSYPWTWYNRAESNNGIVHGAITKFRWTKQVTRDFGNVNIPDKFWTRYCLNIWQQQLVQLLNWTVLNKQDICMHTAAWVVPQMVEALRHKTGGSGFDFRRVLGNFEVSYSFGPHSVALKSSRPQTEMRTGRHV